jgi:hypothetical protein
MNSFEAPLVAIKGNGSCEENDQMFVRPVTAHGLTEISGHETRLIEDMPVNV